MIAAAYKEGVGFAVGQADVPKVTDIEMLVRVAASSICGTDKRIIRTGHRKLKPGRRIILGHEFAGTVENAGVYGGDYPAGTRVVVAPNIGCGRCDMCIRGLYNMCPDYEAFGITIDGGHAEYVALPHATIAQGSVVKLPEGLRFAEACLAEPLSCVVNGMRSCRIEPGDTVVIFGAGPIGLMHLMLAGRSGAVRMIVVDPLAGRLEKARQLGADIVIDPGACDVKQEVMAATGGRGANVAVTACPVPSVQAESLELLGPYGQLCLFGGLPAEAQTVPISTNIIHYRSLLVTGVTGGPPADLRAAVKLMSSGAVDAGQVVSHVFGIEEMAEAFECALAGDCMKVVIEGAD